VEDSCEHGNELSGSIKCREIFAYLHNWRLLKKASAPWSELWKAIIEICIKIFKKMQIINDIYCKNMKLKFLVSLEASVILP
jgi:hypothetical protein